MRIVVHARATSSKPFEKAVMRRNFSFVRSVSSFMTVAASLAVFAGCGSSAPTGPGAPASSANASPASSDAPAARTATSAVGPASTSSSGAADATGTAAPAPGAHASGTPSATDSAPKAAPTPAFYRMKLGAFDVVALSDGIFELPSDKLLVDDEPGNVKRLLDKAHLATVVPTSVNAFLIDTGKKRILVDSGCGTLFGPSLGKFRESLHAAGYEPDQIDEILITHLHPDHFGGLTADAKMVFPKAVIRLDEREAAFWQNEANKSKVHASVQTAFAGATATLKTYAAAGHVKTFKTGTEIEPGITAIARTGHTIGHTTYRVQSQGKTLLLWGDLVHVEAVQMSAPNITLHFDSTPTEARASRRAVLTEASKQGYLVAASHIAFPGIGQVVTEGTAYAWKPVKTD
jgi:glyoxylase-like metal-dependent hydrolase (beta-lactamase superfamily II)